LFSSRKDGWVWYLEEVSCQGQAGCGQTKTTGRVFAMNLATSVEQTLTFRMDETVTSGLSPGEFWPNS